LAGDALVSHRAATLLNSNVGYYGARWIAQSAWGIFGVAPGKCRNKVSRLLGRRLIIALLARDAADPSFLRSS
jgi:hypothetical protein